jgi:hypothetical protein
MTLSVRATFEMQTNRTVSTGRLRRIVEPGVVTLSIGHSSEDLPFTIQLPDATVWRMQAGTPDACASTPEPWRSLFSKKELQ